MIAVPLALEFTPTRLRTRVVGFVTTAMVPDRHHGRGASSRRPLPWRAAFAIGAAADRCWCPSSLSYVPGVAALARRQGPPARGARRGRLADRAPGGGAGARGAAAPRRPATPTRTCGATGAACSSPCSPGSAPRSRCRAWSCGARRSSSASSTSAPTRPRCSSCSSRSARSPGASSSRSSRSALGRRTCGLLMGFGAAPPLVLAAFSERRGGGRACRCSSLALIPAAFFVDGGFANLAPYTPEVFPTSLRTHGMGLAWAVSGARADHRPAGHRPGCRNGRPGRPGSDPRRPHPLLPLPRRIRPTGRHRLPDRPPGTPRPRP